MPTPDASPRGKEEEKDGQMAASDELLGLFEGRSASSVSAEIELLEMAIAREATSRDSLREAKTALERESHTLQEQLLCRSEELEAAGGSRGELAYLQSLSYLATGNEALRSELAALSAQHRTMLTSLFEEECGGEIRLPESELEDAVGLCSGGAEECKEGSSSSSDSGDSSSDSSGSSGSDMSPSGGRGDGSGAADGCVDEGSSDATPLRTIELATAWRKVMAEERLERDALEDRARMASAIKLLEARLQGAADGSRRRVISADAEETKSQLKVRTTSAVGAGLTAKGDDMDYSAVRALRAGVHGLPYEFDEEDSEENIEVVGDERGQMMIKMATLNKLIERLTHEKYPDLNIRFVFLLTYRSFTTPMQLLKKLIHRYFVPMPHNMTPGELKLFSVKKLAPIQIKVLSVLKYWLEDHFHDFEKVEDVKSLFNRFVSYILTHNTGGAYVRKTAPQLQRLMLRMESGGSVKVEDAAMRIEDPILPRGVDLTMAWLLPSDASPAGGLYEIDPLEIARHLTLLDFDIFRQIRPKECIGQAWAKKGKEKNAPNIVAMTDRFNRLSRFVSNEVLRCRSPHQRAGVLQKWIRVSQAALTLSNINTVYAIYCALSSTPIFRLKNTWKELKQATQHVWENLRRLCRLDRNMKALRDLLRNTVSPCIPYLGIFQTDLTFIEEGNRDSNDDKVNFVRNRQIAGVIEKIKQYQQSPYNLKPHAVLLRLLDELPVDSEVDLHDLSREREPRSSHAH